MALEEAGYFDLISDMHRPKGEFGFGRNKDTLESIKSNEEGIKDYNPSLPVVSFKLKEDFKRENPHVKQAALSTLLRTRGWIVPNYTLPANEDKVEVLRIVVRESFSQDLVDRIVTDIIWAAETLAASEQQFDVDILTRKSDPLTDAHRLETPPDDKGAYGKQC